MGIREATVSGTTEVDGSEVGRRGHARTMHQRGTQRRVLQSEPEPLRGAALVVGTAGDGQVSGVPGLSPDGQAPPGAVIHCGYNPMARQ